jgi:hypothetical protein
VIPLGLVVMGLGSVGAQTEVISNPARHIHSIGLIG